MKKRVEDLERGDVVKVSGVEFVVEAKVNLRIWQPTGSC